MVPGTGSYPVAQRVRLPSSRLFAKGRDPNCFKGSWPLCSSSVTTIRTPDGHTLTTTPSFAFLVTWINLPIFL